MLLDAGAGTKWSYKSKESGKVYSRSEGLAVASLEMFKAGAFSNNPSQPHRVDASGLSKVTVETLARGMQVSEANPMSGLEGRAGLLIRLGSALQGNTEIFGADGRPGNMIGNLFPFGSSTTLTWPRLFDISSYYSSGVRPCCRVANSMECAHGWTIKHLARHPDYNSGNAAWGRLAMPSYAQLPSSSTLGDDRAFSQADAVAVLLFDGSHD